jgi:hypothetical protein
MIDWSSGKGPGGDERDHRVQQQGDQARGDVGERSESDRVQELASDGVVEDDPKADADGAGEAARWATRNEVTVWSGVAPRVRRMAWLRAVSWAENTVATMALITARAMRNAATVNPRASRSMFAVVAAREIGSGSSREGLAGGRPGLRCAVRGRRSPRTYRWSARTWSP